jgi:hypothetical protein
VKNESQLLALAERLAESKIDHILWREQPEDIVTGLSTRPILKDDVGNAFKKCDLFK